VIVPTGFAEAAAQGLPLAPGVNNFRAFALGRGPDPRGTLQPVFGLAGFETLKLDFQVDYTIYSGLTVDEESKVYVVSGGTPAGVGLDPSPTLGEILVFTDQSRANRRTDFVDLRTAGTLPNPPSAGTNQGDAVSDRFDHIFWQAPLDPLTVTPVGVAGLARGFLMYLNRTRATAQFPTLPNGGPQAHDVFHGPNPFNAFDPSHQVAGGDITFFPGPINVDYEFLFGGISGGGCVASWTDFFLNSNGNVTFGAGDISAAASAAAFLSGAPRIAPAWTDLNPGSRAGFVNTFPIQAMGFAGINNFKVRWINVPENGHEAAGSRNTFAVSLFDDGTGSYTPSPTHQKGPTALRFELQSDGTLIGLPPRAAGTAPFAFQYGRMDLQGSGANSVLAGYSIGGQAPGAAGPTNLGEAGRTAAVGTGNEVAIFEVFSSGNLDLRLEGNDAAFATASAQPDLDRDYLAFVGKTCAAPPAAVLPTLTLSLGQSNLHPGQSLTLNATLTPGPVATPVNIFVLVQLPTGQIFSFTPGGFVPGVVPVLTGFTPVPFSGTIFSLPLPGGLPLGTYTWFSALTGSGAPFIIGDTLNIGQVPFNFQP
jgi:hypothetical protein